MSLNEIDDELLVVLNADQWRAIVRTWKVLSGAMGEINHMKLDDLGQHLWETLYDPLTVPYSELQRAQLQEEKRFRLPSLNSANDNPFVVDAIDWHDERGFCPVYSCPNLADWEKFRNSVRNVLDMSFRIRRVDHDHVIDQIDCSVEDYLRRRKR